MTNNKELNDFDEKFKNQLFDKISEIFLELNETISQIRQTEPFTNLVSDLPNIGITLNNKIIELQNVFAKAGLSIYSKNHEEYQYVGTSFIGTAIIEDLINYVGEATQELSYYEKFTSAITNEKVNQIQTPKKDSPIKSFFKRVKKDKIPTQKEITLYSQEETDKINQHLSKYRDLDEKLWNYNLKDNIVPSIVKRIRMERYSASTVPGLLEECVIPDLQKLGLSNLVPELQSYLIDEYKKDLPTYNISEENMDLYIPDFNKKSENIESSEAELNELFNTDQELPSEIKSPKM